MKSFVYPAIFIKDKEDEMYRVLIPDLELTTDGAFMEEAYLYAKAMLKAYFSYIDKYSHALRRRNKRWRKRNLIIIKVQLKVEK